MTALRFSIVVSRYGEDILGGAEAHARQLAEKLAGRGHDVRVLTTCARRYQTWRNELPPGRARLRGVEVVRFPTRLPRLRPLDDVAGFVATRRPDSLAAGLAWGLAQGPWVPGLERHLTREAPTRDLVVFFSLLQWPTYRGLAAAPGNAVLVPLVHDEPPTYTRWARETLRRPRAILANTEEELARIHSVVGDGAPPSAVVGVGMDAPPARRDDFRPPTRHPYLLILGRLAKTRPMLALWRELRRRTDAPALELPTGGRVAWRDIRLVTVGESSAAYRDLPGVIGLPFVDEATRWQLVWSAEAVINPSRLESLSLVLLEAWACRRPVVVNAACDVTVGQCQRSGGGVAVSFTRPEAGAVDLARGLAAAAHRAEMGAGGRDYVTTRYRWDRILAAYEAAARAVRTGAPLGAALAPWAPGAAAEGPACA